MKMKPHSKRWRRAILRSRRKLRRADLRWAKADLQALVDKVFARGWARYKAPLFARDRDAWLTAVINRHTRAVKRLNKNLRKFGGYSLCDGTVECPKCHRERLTIADPDEWTRNDNPARSRRTHDVSSYWPGTAQCCELLLAPEFEQQVIDLSESHPCSSVSSVVKNSP